MDASRELDGIVEFFEKSEVDVDQLVARLERATAIVDELDRRIRRTRAQVEELVPKLEAAGRGAPSDADDDAADGVDAPSGGRRRAPRTGRRCRSEPAGSGRRQRHGEAGEPPQRDRVAMGHAVLAELEVGEARPAGDRSTPAPRAGPAPPPGSSGSRSRSSWAAPRRGRGRGPRDRGSGVGRGWPLPAASCTLLAGRDGAGPRPPSAAAPTRPSSCTGLSQRSSSSTARCTASGSSTRRRSRAQLVGVAQQRPQAVADEVGGGLEARREEQDGGGDHLVLG